MVSQIVLSGLHLACPPVRDVAREQEDGGAPVGEDPEVDEGRLLRARHRGQAGHGARRPGDPRAAEAELGDVVAEAGDAGPGLGLRRLAAVARAGVTAGGRPRSARSSSAPRTGSRRSPAALLAGRCGRSRGPGGRRPRCLKGSRSLPARSRRVAPGSSRETCAWRRARRSRRWRRARRRRAGRSPPLPRTTGTATRATSSATATGHRRFSTRSAQRFFRKVTRRAPGRDGGGGDGRPAAGGSGRWRSAWRRRRRAGRRRRQRVAGDQALLGGEQVGGRVDGGVHVREPLALAVSEMPSTVIRRPRTVIWSPSSRVKRSSRVRKSSRWKNCR